MRCCVADPNPYWTDLDEEERLLIYSAILDIRVLTPGDNRDFKAHTAKTAALRLLTHTAGERNAFVLDSGKWSYYKDPKKEGE